MLKFIAHTILLENGKSTRPGCRLLSETEVMKAIKRSVLHFVPEARTNPAGLSVVDLGSFEGGYTIEFARSGFKTLGIEARRQNLLKATYAKLAGNVPNAEFQMDDVRNLHRYGPFDITLCLGILYHIDRPAEFLKMISQQTRRILVLHTFYAPGKDLRYTAASLLHSVRHLFTRKPPFLPRAIRKATTAAINENGGYIQHPKNYRLGALTRHEGYTGRWFQEWKKNTGKERIERMPGASYNNQSSFWHCKPDLIRALYDAGFSSVYEQTDPIGDLTDRYPAYFYGRTLLVAVKDPVDGTIR